LLLLILLLVILTSGCQDQNNVFPTVERDENIPAVISKRNPETEKLHFFFTPDVSVPPEETLLDQVSGIWVSRKSGDMWGKPQRVWLQKPDVLALDGAVTIQGNEMWFASAREGYVGVSMFTAEWMDDRYTMGICG
jgi:hypothetical protein